MALKVADNNNLKLNIEERMFPLLFLCMFLSTYNSSFSFCNGKNLLINKTKTQAQIF